jgi:hypothetical protein
MQNACNTWVTRFHVTFSADAGHGKDTQKAKTLQRSVDLPARQDRQLHDSSTTSARSSLGS